MGATPTFDLYIDESGSRLPDRREGPRKDGVDAFAFGGVLVASEEAFQIHSLVEAVRKKHELDCPLHSTKIRTKKDGFAWLGRDEERAQLFYADIEALFAKMSGWVTAAVVHRPGYNKRYRARYGEARWRLCQTAYPILLERCAKFAAAHGRRLKVYAEESGAKEEACMQSYQSDLISKGIAFEGEEATKYSPMAPGDLERVVVRKIDFIKKTNPFAQAADLVLFPLIKGRYDRSYRPFQQLCQLRKVLDFHLPAELRACGVKYSCFDGAEFSEQLFG